jgi:hypothetical protein
VNLEEVARQAKLDGDARVIANVLSSMVATSIPKSTINPRSVPRFRSPLCIGITTRLPVSACK